MHDDGPARDGMGWVCSGTPDNTSAIWKNRRPPHNAASRLRMWAGASGGASAASGASVDVPLEDADAGAQCREPRKAQAPFRRQN